MFELENITTLKGSNSEPKTAGYLHELLPYLHQEWITDFEWLFGLQERDFNLGIDLNMFTVHCDLLPYLQRRQLSLAPSVSVLELAFEIMDHNANASFSERRSYKELGEGPWEYVLFPGVWSYHTKQPEDLPDLYYRSSDGTQTPISFDPFDHTTLPRVTSTLHPTILMFQQVLGVTSSTGAPEGLVRNVILPMQNVYLRWPGETHNRFIPLPTSPRRKRPLCEGPACECTVCQRWAYGSDGSSSSFDTWDSGTVDSESWRNPEPTRVFVNGDARVARWLGGIKSPLKTQTRDILLRRYAKEASKPAQQVFDEAVEETKRREALAKPILEVVKAELSARSSRPSKRSRRC